MPEASKRVLIAPLEWGLGHATRCVPVIRELLGQGAEVILAADGRPFHFLQREFPQLEIIRLPGYGITYPKSSALGLHLLLQSPRIARMVRTEEKAIGKIARENKIDSIITDNRFVCRTDFTYNIFITHQLRVKAPLAENVITKIHRGYYEKFNEVWVPDAEGENNLSGELSHGVKTKVPVHYVGPLTRFSKINERSSHEKIVVLLSGPEPQRTIFENIVLKQAENYPAEFLFLRGRTEGDPREEKKSATITFINHLPTEQLAEALASAKAVICRSGYSTLCDLTAFDVPALVVPTPGQTEQEYLAGYHSQKGNVATMQQNDFNLAEGLNKLRDVQPLNVMRDESLLRERVRSVIEK